MKSKIKLVILFVLSSTELHGQERLWTKQSKIKEVIAFEKEINPKVQFLNKNVRLSNDYYPLGDKYEVTNPIVVQREALMYLPIYAEYFYSSSDSILRLVSYDWEKDRYGNYNDKLKIWKEESKKLTLYNEEYERIKTILLVQLGTPTSSDTKFKEVSYYKGKYFTRETLWNSEDIYAKLNMIFESTTYRIRMTIYWKK